MGGRRELARRLSAVRPFDHPRIDLEQYATPAEVAASIVHLADLRGDLAANLVIDLGAGTGMLAIGCACRHPRRVIGIERDGDAIRIARENVERVDPGVPVEFVRGDVLHSPLRDGLGATIVMNPPFGAQHGNVHADRLFLDVASRVATVSYSLHNDGSRDFVAAFAADNGGTITDEAAATFDLERQFPHHRAERTEIPVELYRIVWGDRD